MVSLSTWHNRKMPDGPRTVIVGGPGWDPNPDHTTMMIQDWGVLTIYYRFLKDWLHISRKMVQDQTDLHQRWSSVSAAVVPEDEDGDDNDDSSASTVDRQTPSTPLPCIRHRRCGSSKHNKLPKTSGSVTQLPVPEEFEHELLIYLNFLSLYIYHNIIMYLLFYLLLLLCVRVCARASFPIRFMYCTV